MNGKYSPMRLSVYLPPIIDRKLSKRVNLTEIMEQMVQTPRGPLSLPSPSTLPKASLCPIYTSLATTIYNYPANGPPRTLTNPNSYLNLALLPAARNNLSPSPLCFILQAPHRQRHRPHLVPHPPPCRMPVVLAIFSARSRPLGRRHRPPLQFPSPRALSQSRVVGRASPSLRSLQVWTRTLRCRSQSLPTR